MKITMVVPFEETVPPQRYGGIELVVANLIEELVAMGHSVTLLGVGGSKVPCKLVPIFDEPIRQLPEAANELAREAYTDLGIARVLDELRSTETDIVHNHLGAQFLIFRKQISQPVITTVHLSLEDKRQRILHGRDNSAPLVSISRAQRRASPDLNYVDNIYNGVKVDSFTFREKPGDYLAFLGSIIPHKGLDKAIEIAKRCSKQLVIGAKIDPLQQRYFETEIKPHIDNDQIVYLGEIEHSEKDDLLSRAEALLMPIGWDEPFGLVVAEAFSCGTPAIGFRRGSLPELIEHGRTGFLGEDIDQLVGYVGRVSSLDRKACRKAAETRFNSRLMAEQYVKVYEKLK